MDGLVWLAVEERPLADWMGGQMTTSRRGFLKLLGLGTAAAGAAVVLPKAMEPAPLPLPKLGYQAKIRKSSIAKDVMLTTQSTVGAMEDIALARAKIEGQFR